jgi:hypothetical protein
MSDKSYIEILQKSDNPNITFLLEQNKLLYKNIENMNNMIVSIRKVIDDNNKYIIKNCNHKWNIDHSVLDEKTVYYCSLCNSQTYNTQSTNIQ